MNSEKEEDFDMNNHFFVHNDPISPDEFRHFCEKEISVFVLSE